MKKELVKTTITDRPNNPFVKLSNLLQFIKNRRKDSRFPIVPLSHIFKLSIVFIIFLAIAFAKIDQPFFDAHRADAIFQSIYIHQLSHVAESSWILIISAVLFFILSFVPGDKFQGKQHAVWHRLFFTNWFILYSVGVSGILVNVFKFLFGRSRPRYVTGESAFDFTPLSSGYDFASFPSGHSTTAGALLMCLVLLFPRYKIIFIILGVATACTRPFVGAHFPSDVVAGLALGAVFTWIYARSLAKNRILFKFSNNGNLLLRNEGYGYCHNIPSMILQCFVSKKN